MADLTQMRSVHVFYRLANRPAAQPKDKPEWATKENCLRNAIQVFGGGAIHVFGDRLNADMLEIVRSLDVRITEVDEGSGGGNFRAAAHAAMRLPDDEIIYLLEDDFIHRVDAREALLDGIDQGEAYVTLYDHPDKYLSPGLGGNPLVKKGGEKTRLLCGHVCHWKVTNSTVMTFATTVRQLQRDWKVFLKYCGSRYTDDYRLFRALAWRGRRVISAVPGFATHCESQYLSPLVDWHTIEQEMPKGSCGDPHRRRVNQ